MRYVRIVLRVFLACFDFVFFPLAWLARGEGETRTRRFAGGYYGDQAGASSALPLWWDRPEWKETR